MLENPETLQELRDKLARHLSVDDKRLALSTQQFKMLISDDQRVDFCLGLLDEFNMEIKFVQQVKDDGIAEKWRERGNEMFKLKKAKEALEFYTKSIGFAEEKSKNLALAYANRSAVFFENKMYDLCIEDIKRAHENEYPEELRHKLMVREKNAKNLNEKVELNYHEEIPQLPTSNDSIECASGSVQIKNDSVSGRHVCATKDISIGEVIAIERPFLTLLVDEFYNHCHHCLKLCYNLVPCSFCTSTFYCSDTCQFRAFETYHQYECTISNTLKLIKIDKLKRFPLKILFCIKDKVGANLELNPKEVYRSGRYEEIHNLCTNSERRLVSDLFDRAVTAAFLFCLIKNHTHFFEDGDPQLEVFAKKILMKHLQTGPSNFHEISELVKNKDGIFEPMEIASGAYAFLSMLNHSCNPNVTRNCYGDTIVLRAIRSIKAGEQVFDNYGYHFALSDREERHSFLREQYLFACNCVACRSNWPRYDEMPYIQKLPDVADDIFVKLGQADLDTACDRYLYSLTKLKECEPYMPCQNFFKIQEVVKQCLAIFGNKRKFF